MNKAEAINILTKVYDYAMRHLEPLTPQNGTAIATGQAITSSYNVVMAELHKPEPAKTDSEA